MKKVTVKKSKTNKKSENIKCRAFETINIFVEKWNLFCK